MKITKYGHCCLLIEEGGLRILTDPGVWSVLPQGALDLDVILITHEHADHLHMESLKNVLKSNPDAKVITNSAVGKILDTEEIGYQVLEHGQKREEKGVLIEGHGNDHAMIYPELVPQVQNTGYFINNKLFYPGDAFHDPRKPVEILALPVAAPWLKISEVLNYLKVIKPKKAFPVHDGFLKESFVFHRLPAILLEKLGGEFTVMNEGDEAEF